MSAIGGAPGVPGGSPLAPVGVSVSAPYVLVIEHEDGTGPGFLGETMVSCGLGLVIVRPYLDEALPSSLTGFDGLVVLGGTPAPYDDAATPWLPEVRSLVEEALARETPTLGVCLGGEILAMVAGGKVCRSTRGVEIGLHTLSLSPAAADDPLFCGLPSAVPAVEWHIEEIVELPPGTVSLAASERFPHQAFRVGPTAWGTQFHPEVLTAAADAWAANDSGDLAAAGLTRDDVVREVSVAEPELRRVWGLMASRWAELVRTRACLDDPSAG